MDLLKVGHFYIEHILKISSKNNNDSINVLLLDDYTTSVLSIVSSQSELLNHNIFLIDKIGNLDSRDKFPNLNCIVFISPTTLSIDQLNDELKFPKYKKYSIFFTNYLQKSKLESIAECDDYGLVKSLQEVFWDYLILNSSLYQVSSSNISMNLISLLLSLKIKPIIRYETNSKKCLRLANEIFYEINNNANINELFNDISNKNKPLLLIVDRKNDPLTPLLTPWSYQSMIHEYLKIDKNIVDLSSLKQNNEDDLMNKIILNTENDKFYNEAMNLNFADLSDKITSLVNNYKLKTMKNSNNLSSLDDMKQFLEEYPEFKKLSHNVNKHITITSELEKQITKNNLWEISHFEQDLSMGKDKDFSNHTEDFTKLKTLLDNPSTDEHFKVKLISIYCLKYEDFPGNHIKEIKPLLLPTDQQLLDNLLERSGFKKRLFNESSIGTNPNNNEIAFGFTNSNNNQNLSIFTPNRNTGANNLISTLKSMSKESKNKTLNINELDYEDEQSNSVYMQHKPRLLYVIQNILSKKLNGRSYPILNPYKKAGNASGSLSHLNYDNASLNNEEFQEIVIFFVDGVTYEESRMVALLNDKYKELGLKFIIGSSQVINSSAYLEQLRSLVIE